MISYSVQANLKNCKDESVLAGVCCTNMCQHWNDCTIASQPILIKSIVMKGDVSGNAFYLKEFPDWTDFDHNNSGVKKMIRFQPESWINSLYDDSTEKISSNAPKEKQPSTIYNASLKGKLEGKSFHFENNSQYSQGSWING